MKKAIKSTTLKVYKPEDFIYFNSLGSGAFGKVRRCKLKKNVVPNIVNNLQIDDANVDVEL